MKLSQPYKCDYCPNVKTASNHWFLSIGDGLEFRLIPWDSLEADRGSVRHVCSESCAVKSLNKYMEARSAPASVPGALRGEIEQTPEPAQIVIPSVGPTRFAERGWPDLEMPAVKPSDDDMAF